MFDRIYIVLFFSHSILLTSGLGDGRDLDYRRTKVLIIVPVLRILVSARTASFLLVRREIVTPGWCGGRSPKPWRHPALEVPDEGELPYTARKNSLIVH